MRKFLLAGAAFAAAAAYMPTTAHAQDSSGGTSPVTVYIGGRMFVGVFLEHSTGQNSGTNKYSTAAYPNYMRLYPSADYAAPNGVHYGFSAELRSWNSSTGSGGTRYGQPTGNLYWEHAYGYVSSAQAGKLEFGTPETLLAITEVGDGSDIGTGGYDGEYGWSGTNGSPKWLFPDNAEGRVAIQYYSPSFAGFSAAVGYTPNDDNSLDGSNITSTSDSTSIKAGKTHNMVNGAISYGGTFGPVGVKAEVGGLYSGYVNETWAGAVQSQDQTMLDAGLAVTYAGITFGGHIDAGKFGPSQEPLPKGAKTTVVAAANVQYTLPNPRIPLTFGGGWYHYDLDASQYTMADGNAGTAGKRVKFNGAAVGATYKLVPGVTLFLDALWGEQKAPASEELADGHNKVTSTGLGIGTYFQW